MPVSSVKPNILNNNELRKLFKVNIYHVFAEWNQTLIDTESDFNLNCNQTMIHGQNDSIPLLVRANLKFDRK